MRLAKLIAQNGDTLDWKYEYNENTKNNVYSVIAKDKAKSYDIIIHIATSLIHSTKEYEFLSALWDVKRGWNNLYLFWELEYNYKYSKGCKFNN